jgi:hypothetical protein
MSVSFRPLAPPDMEPQTSGLGRFAAGGRSSLCCPNFVLRSRKHRRGGCQTVVGDPPVDRLRHAFGVAVPLLDTMRTAMPSL